jgi:nucleoside-diphosphate-sugar epimerase
LKALVTGIAGFTGRYLAQVLASRGVAVVGIGQSSDYVEHVEKVYPADITDLASLRDVVLAERPDYVVHLAAISFVEHDNIEEIYRTNLIGTRNLLEALTVLTSPPKSVLLASSSNIYGNRNEGIMREDMRPHPVNDYSVSKIAAEMVAGLFGRRLPLIVVRPFNYTGRGQSPEFIIPKIVDHVRRGEAMIELGNLEVARDFSDVRMVVDAYSRLLDTPKAIGGIYNVCSGRPLSLGEVLEMVAAISGHRLKVEVNPSLVRANEVKQLWGSPAKLEGVIGPLNLIPLEETLRWMLQG